MEQLLPPLSAEQFSALEGDILENGCYAPVIANEDMVIVDGHNRLCICEKHSLTELIQQMKAEIAEAKELTVQGKLGEAMALANGKKPRGTRKQNSAYILNTQQQ